MLCIIRKMLCSKLHKSVYGYIYNNLFENHITVVLVLRDLSYLHMGKHCKIA